MRILESHLPAADQMVLSVDSLALKKKLADVSRRAGYPAVGRALRNAHVPA